jgi:hypothetical protein
MPEIFAWLRKHANKQHTPQEWLDIIGVTIICGWVGVPVCDWTEQIGISEFMGRLEQCSIYAPR